MTAPNAAAPLSDDMNPMAVLNLLASVRVLASYLDRTGSDADSETVECAVLALRDLADLVDGRPGKARPG